ncbi:MAG TPA: hypothetical protein VJV79_16220 [Polyangiaceae bacterium]|nr:hypothetical protein [Polyangiaceae bacterium]
MSLHKRFALDAPLLGLCCIALCTATRARAEEPHKASEPRVLKEPAEITQVADAFDDDDDIFDLNLSLGYESTWSSAVIRRDTTIDQPGLGGGGYLQSDLNVAQYNQVTSRLLTRADIGLYKDLALVVRVPIILSDDRELKGIAGSENQQSVTLAGAPGEQLFSLPFKSPTRSGIEYLALGIDAGLMNQMRNSARPTWVIGVEGRFNVSEPMHACNPNGNGLNQASGQVQCAYPSDLNRNGKSGEYPNADAGPLEGNFSGSRSPGVSRGTTAIEAHTYLSRRLKYIEPYAGFRALVEFQNKSTDYGSTNLKGVLANHPPLRGTLLFGVNVIPWEIREQFQRITLDFRFTGTYVSEGRDYSELFDALGSSDAPSLRVPNYAEYQQNPNCTASTPCDQAPSVINPRSEKVYFTGITGVQAHGTYRLSAAFTWQAGEYIKFHVGSGYTLVQSHFITVDQACSPSSGGDGAKAGPCRGGGAPASSASTASGTPNPNFRRVIDDPGHRFKVDESHAIDAWINATVMF